MEQFVVVVVVGVPPIDTERSGVDPSRRAARQAEEEIQEKENNGIISLIIVAHRLFSSSLFPNFQLG